MISFSLYAGGRDDAKLLIPATVLLRYMFTTAEMMVSSELSILCLSATHFFLVDCSGPFAHLLPEVSGHSQ